MPLVKKNIIRNIFKSPFLHRIWQLSILNFREHATSLRSPKNLSNLLILLISYLHFVRTFIALFNSIYTWIWYVCKKLGKEPVRSQMTHYRFTNFCCFYKIFKFFLNLERRGKFIKLGAKQKVYFSLKSMSTLIPKSLQVGSKFVALLFVPLHMYVLSYSLSKSNIFFLTFWFQYILFYFASYL